MRKIIIIILGVAFSLPFFVFSQEECTVAVVSGKAILRYIARDLVNEKTDPYPLPFEGQEDGKPLGFIRTHHSINRFRTASGAVFHGVLPDENPLLTTMWVILGEPICGVAILLWVAAGTVPAAVDGDSTAQMNHLIQQLEMKAYPDTSLKRYVDTNMLINKQGKGLLPLLFNLEDNAVRITEKRLQNWRRRFPPSTEIMRLEIAIVDKTVNRYRKTIDKYLLKLR